MTDVVHVEREDPVARVEIDHPPVNALNGAVVDGLAEAFETLAAEDDVRVVVVQGAGDRAFVAGADIREFTQADGEAEARELLRLPRVLAEIAAFPKPVVAALNGNP